MTPAPGRPPRSIPPPSVVYLGILLGMAVALLSGSPIVAQDTDLWYHLNGGRYILQHHALPRDTAFLSFLDPPRPLVDYYWLFQVLVYWLHAWWGYEGLIACRSLLYAAAVAGILWILFRRREAPRSTPWLVCVSVWYALALLPRGVMVRPHAVTYAAIAACLALLECRPRGAAALLPLLALLWCNLHGIAYPLLLLIVGAYLLEAAWERLTKPPRPQGLPRPLRWAAAAACLAPLLSPHGLRLLRVPFISTGDASQYIAELQPVSLAEFLSPQAVLLAPTHTTVLQLLLLAAMLAALSAVASKTLRLSHALLGLGGIVLLTKGWRFSSECVLLLLPLLAAHPLVPAARVMAAVSRPVSLAVTTLLMVMPLRFLMTFFDERPRYPLNPERLPTGVVAFLRHVNVGGTLLNHPNSGGYLEWSLGPRYRIFADMQVPFAFTDEDLYVASHLLVDRGVLESVVAHYQPSFITVPNTASEFPGLLAQAAPGYTMVFFDDQEVLYVDRRQHPDLAERFGLTALDPFKVLPLTESEFIRRGGDWEAVMREVGRILAIDPECALANTLAATLYLHEQAYDRALPYTEAIIRAYPHWAKGHRLKADALRGLRAYDRAIALYEAAKARSSPAARASLQRKIALVSYDQGQYARAYQLLRQTLNRFSVHTSREDLYTYARAARLTGKRREAEQFLRYLRSSKVGSDKAAWSEKIEAELQELAR